jgi:hypothetical protein
MPLRGMNVHELQLWDGLTKEDAEEEMAKRVFGHDYRRDKHGNPIEQGIGSASQQTEHHKRYAAKERERQLLIDAAAARVTEAAARTGR